MTTFQDPPMQSRRAARQGERNAAYGLQPEQDAEPLTYSTQNRAPLPHYDGPDFRARRTPEASTGEPDEAATQMLPEQDVPTYRPRDYSPEGRGSHVAPVTPDAAAPVAAAPTQQAPVEQTPVEHAPQPVEYTLTRRELRALREAQGAQVEVPPREPAPSSFAPQPAAPAPAVSEPEVPDSAAPESAATESAAPEPAATESAAPESAAPAPTAEAAPAPQLSPFEALFAPPSDNAPAPAPRVEPLVDPIAAEPVVAEPVAAASVTVEPVIAEPAAAEPAVAEPVEPQPGVPAARAARRPGHWSTQGALDDATQVNESTISRNVGAGSGAITTSALVLPSLPNPEFAQLGTGEILVTGSIDLPHSLATSGAHPKQLDEHHLDHELDPGDHQVVSTDSQPVRAVRAVSSHTSTRNVIVAKKPVGNRALTALIISAAGMAAVVVTLLVVGLVSGVL